MKGIQSAAAKLRVPGLVWAALLVAATAFLMTNFPDAPWLPLVLIAAAGGLRALGIEWKQVFPNVPDPIAGGSAPTPVHAAAQEKEAIWPSRYALVTEKHKRRTPLAQLLL